MIDYWNGWKVVHRVIKCSFKGNNLELASCLGLLVLQLVLLRIFRMSLESVHWFAWSQQHYHSDNNTCLYYNTINQSINQSIIGNNLELASWWGWLLLQLALLRIFGMSLESVHWSAWSQQHYHIDNNTCLYYNTINQSINQSINYRK